MIHAIMGTTLFATIAWQQNNSGSNQWMWISLLGIILLLLIIWLSRSYNMEGQEAEVVEEAEEAVVVTPAAAPPESHAEEIAEPVNNPAPANPLVEESAPVPEAAAPLAASLGDTQAVEASAEVQEAEIMEQIEHAPPTPSAPDDLKKIEGIGPKISGILNEAGIYTFAELSQTAVSDLEQMLAGKVRLSFPDTWPEQAALAAEGKWAELETFQNSLKGGRRA